MTTKTTKILNRTAMKELQPAVTLWDSYHPKRAPLRFKARTLSQARLWQATTQKALLETLGFQDLPRVAPAPRQIERVDKGDYIREKVVIRTSPTSRMPVYLLYPKHGRKPFPMILAFHGHGYGVKDIVGLWEDGRERNTPDGYHQDFAVTLCRRGFAVAAPEISCFGERLTDFSYLNTKIGQSAPSTCTHAAMLAFHLGKSVIGLRVWEARRLLDFLQTRKEFDTSRTGAMGISGGGAHTFFSTCVDPRIKACVISGYYSTFRDSILGISHCACNFVPGLHVFGEMYDLVGLIAPRPILIEAGSYDPIFPIDAVRRSIFRARNVYRVFGAESAIETDYFEGRHRISGRRAYNFLWNKLADCRAVC